MSSPRPISARLAEHVERLGAEHPPIDLASVDYRLHDPAGVAARFGHVLDYMARVELEVDRNVLELTTMLPDPPEIDRRFYADVWQPQEIRHGQILDALQMRLGRPATVADTESISLTLRVLGALGRIEPLQDISRMLYYLTGMATERSAVLAYNALHDGLSAMGEQAVVETIVAPIRRQEPGHFAFYRLSAIGLAAQLAPWQRWLVRRLRALSFAPVGVTDARQRADFGDVMIALDLDRDLDDLAAGIAKIEHDLIGAGRRGLRVPTYVATAFEQALESARHRSADGAAAR